MEQAKKYQALYYPTPGRPWIRARYLYLMGDYEFKVFDKSGKLAGVYECMHDAEKKMRGVREKRLTIPAK